MKIATILATLCLVFASCAPVESAKSQAGATAIESAKSQIAATAVVSASATATSAPVQTATAMVSAAPQAQAKGKIPNFEHIILIVFENHGYGEVIGNSQMPYLNSLAKQYVLLSKDYAVTHPSLPNYIALVSGDTQNITKDCTKCFVNQPNLADLIETSGRTWKTYQEDMPSACFVGDADPYVQKHNPFIYFDAIRTNSTRCSNSVVPLTQLDNDLAANRLPNFAFIMPNLCNSSHDCPLGTADKWLKGTISKLQASPALGKNYLIIVTFDEGTEKDKSACCGLGSSAGGQVATVLISPLAKPGFTDATPVSHYGLLKTILLAWNLPNLGNTQQTSTQPILEPWK
jgi:phosphatidylinositol-3-phosphatase